MRISVDADRCSGHGRCYTLAPEVFESDDDGYCLVRPGDIAADLEDKARSGAQNCPERAITLNP
ncbi:MAG TPA: ferredoxin [Acidimicrobiales bacterium]